MLEGGIFADFQLRQICGPPFETREESADPPSKVGKNM